MSYWCHMEVNAGGESPAYIEGCDLNVTWNVSGIFAAVMDDDTLRDLDGQTGGAIAEKIEGGLRLLDSAPERYRDLQPSNGWGTVETAIATLSTVLSWCRRFPLATFRCQ